MEHLDEIKISKAIIKTYTDKLLKNLELEVAIVGAGPSGMTCGYYLAKEGKKVAIFERKLSVGGGMWAGGILFNQIVVQKKAKEILDELGINTSLFEKNYYVADAVEAVSTLCSKAVKAGVKIFNGLSAEDVLIRNNRICGLVLNWSAVEMAGLHVDPISIKAKFTVDATGHAAEIVHIVEKKSKIKLKTRTSKILGEGSMWVELAEETIVKNSKEVASGLYTCGMSSNTVFGGPRMGPIFGGMLLSGKKVAFELLKRLSY
ncbi:MAG: sulfide-dependent adenosine diphosphate thiazole synthase [Candidatus Omnitrophica bacterium]|nr:sulfide-dependent adenosine diphosphate thiazole synthase [Candidatus Omnitrophota bacterium]